MCKKCLILLILLMGERSVFAQEMPAPQQILRNFAIGADRIAELERGEIVEYEVSETSPKELAVGVAMILPVAFAKVIDYINRGNLGITESDVIAAASLPNNAGLNSFSTFAFTDQQLDEAKAFLNAEPGDQFNLSKQEIAGLKQLQASVGDADNKTILNVANQRYCEILLQRFQAYRDKGLQGIAAYSREHGYADPAIELRNNAVNSIAWTRYFPALQQVWLNYPASFPANANERFYLMNRRVEGRPTATLVHRIMVANESGGIIVSRQFYVGHSYNSSNTVAGGLPYKNGTLVFYSIRSSTDQVAGFGNGLKRLIGREQMKDEMIARLQRLNKDLKLKTTVR